MFFPHLKGDWIAMRKKIAICRESYTNAQRLIIDETEFYPRTGAPYPIIIEQEGDDRHYLAVGDSRPLMDREFIATKFDLLIIEKITHDGLPATVTISVFDLVQAGYTVWLDEELLSQLGIN